MATHVVAAGDTPSSLARRYTGDATRWRELCRANPQLATHAQWGCVFPAPGKIINLPADWVPEPAAATPAPPQPTPDVVDQPAAAQGPMTPEQVLRETSAAPPRSAPPSLLGNKPLLLLVGAAAAAAVAIMILKRKGKA